MDSSETRQIVATVTRIPTRQSPTELPRWYTAPWDDYVAWVETTEAEYFRIFFNQGRGHTFKLGHVGLSGDRS